VKSEERDCLEIYMRRIARSRPLTSEEEASLAVRIRNGDRKALNKFVEANLRFVVSVAKNYMNQGLAFIDLIAAGNVGLVRAAKKFDEKRGFRFISYCVWWIRQAILQELADQSRIVKVPLNQANMLYDIYKSEGQLEQKYGRRPTQEELSQDLKIESEKLELLTYARNVYVSLDAPVDILENEVTLLDALFVEDENNFLESESLKYVVKEILSTLNPRERKICRLYFGLDSNEPTTLSDIGATLGITRERVRQLKEKILKKLKSSKRIRDLARQNT